MNSPVEEVYQFRFFLKGISPIIDRRILINSSRSLADLHDSIQITMGWSDTYLHRFDIWGKDYGLYRDGGMGFSDNAREVYLHDFQFRINEKFMYEYNFFCHWEHEFRLEKKLLLNQKKTYPFCLEGRLACPPEDCGGPEVFMKLMDEYSLGNVEEKILDALDDYEIEQDREMLSNIFEDLRYWVIRYHFDRNKINKQLQRYFHKDNQLTIEEIQDED